MSSTRHLPAQTAPDELPPFVFVPDGAALVRPPAPGPDGAPAARLPAPARRWTTGHTVAAAVVAVGVLVSGGVALAARDSGATAPGVGQLPGGVAPGQLPGPGQLGGPGQLPGGGPVPFGPRDDDHDRNGSGGTPGGGGAVHT